MVSASANYLGVDIGGTKVAAGLVTPAGRILTQNRVPMPARGSAMAGLEAVIAAAKLAMGTKTVAGVGVSSPGPLDPRRGVVLNPPNLPCWRNFPLAAKLEQALGVPVKLDNDANAAALAEARWGAGRRYQAVFYATLGTGIGAGLVLDGRIYHGRTGAAVEGGHLSINHRGPRCGCGKRGCIEALASGPAVGRRARKLVRARPDRARRLLTMAEGRVSGVSGETVGAAWKAGDAIARQTLEETALLLGIWLGNIVDLLEPEIIIFGGGMGALMAEWFPLIGTTLQRWSINPRASEIPLRAARYGSAAGIAGGAALCR
ncbi:MAG TPA: ROK family protein [Terriglobales bacterium]|nr:ROK family protein [Terriglobales bacterium]